MGDEHLGGHLNKTHVDEGALIFLKDVFGVRTMLDIGCGPGGMVELALKHGIRAVGVDGDASVIRLNEKYRDVPGILPLQVVHDYTLGPLPMDIGEEFDLAWSVEFLEHVEERFQENYMESFCRAKVVAMTHALPGAPGYHHVNCQPEQYWIDVFGRYGFDYLADETKVLRKRSTMVKNFMRNTGKIFRRR